MSKQDLVSQTLRMLVGSLLLATTQCDHSQCDDMRDKLAGLKDTWQACLNDADCVVVGGNSKDCTGILSCNFAIHRLHRNEAERVVASLPEDTLDCTECSPPSCIGGSTAHCDTATAHCSTDTVVPAPVPSSSSTASGAQDGGAAGAANAGTADDITSMDGLVFE